MIAKQVKLTVVKIQLKEGVGRTSNRPYSFHVASVIDEDANVFQFNIAKAIVEEYGAKLTDIRNELVTADVEFKPKGFDCAGTLLTLEQ